MAETLGLVASIFAIAGAATKLSIGLYEIASSLKEAGQEVRMVANDTSLLSRVLKELSSTLGTQANISIEARQVTHEIVTVCATIQEDGEQLLHTLNPLIEHSRLHTRFLEKIVLRVRWYFEESKFAYHRDILQSLKGSLQLLISVIGLKNAANHDDFHR
jgi:enoyl-[acyl-carrier-protein] reductase (NADH)